MTFERRFRTAMDKVGGRYVLTALLQKRIRELVRGDRPLVDLDTNDFTEIALAEVIEDKIEMGEEIRDPDEDADFGSSDEMSLPTGDEQEGLLESL